MRKFFWLFLVNILILISISIVTNLLGLNRYITSNGLNLELLALFSLIWGFSGAFISLLLSKRMAINMMNVQLINNDNSRFSDIKYMVHDLAKKAGLAGMPDVGVYQSAEMNAFATGSSEKNSLVAVSTGLLANMNRDELEGVLAHEIAHIKNGDMVIMTLIQGSINAFVIFLSRVLAFAISNMLRTNSNQRDGHGLNYILIFVLEIALSFLGFMAVCYFSRQREYRADAGGAKFSSKDKMRKALEKLQKTFNKDAIEEDKLSAMKINGANWKLLFSTHPPLKDRIQKLM